MHRRRFLSLATVATVGVAGCSSEDGDGNGTESTNGSEEQTQEPPDPEKWETPAGPEVHAYDATADGQELGFAVDVLQDRPMDEVATVEIGVTNETEGTRRLEFEGFVPFSDPVGELEDGDATLLAVPNEQPEGRTVEANDEVPAFEQVGEFWGLAEPLEPPTETATLSLEPGATVAATYAVVLPRADRSLLGDTNGPPLGGYEFASEVAIQGERDATTVELSFEIGVAYVG